MLPTPQAEQRERRRARVRSLLLLLPLLLLSPLLLAVHPLAMLLFVLCALLISLVCYRQGLQAVQRRREILARPFPDEWEAILQERVEYFRLLPPPEQTRFRQLLQVFLAEKKIEGAGVEITDLLLVLTGAGATIPILALDDWEYGRLEVIVIRPEPFEAHFTPDPDEPFYASGLVGDRNIFSGSLILSRSDLLRDFRKHHDRTNVAIHEFAHLVDLAGGAIDGIPPTLPADRLPEWEALVAEFLKNPQDWRNADIPEYAFTNEAEFFAVCSEYFFCLPCELLRQHPQLYQLLCLAYRQHPAERIDNHTAGDPDSHPADDRF